MVWFKRIFLFLAVNILVVLTISALLSLLGVQPYLTARGIDYSALMVFALIWGFGGALISLALSRVMARWMMGVQIIDPNTRDSELQELVQTVYRLSRQAGLPRMPEVGIYDSPEVNAFATGPTRSRALVAVSTGLLHRMRPDEVEGVLGHEVAHVANGDMVTMTLIQGVVNAFVLFLSRALAFAISSALRSRDEEGAATSHGSSFLLVFVLEMVFMVLGSIVVAWFSRWREFRADAGGARLAGRDRMISALESLRREMGRGAAPAEAEPAPAAAFQALKISGSRGRLISLFSTHPPLEERIRRLETMS